MPDAILAVASRENYVAPLWSRAVGVHAPVLDAGQIHECIGLEPARTKTKPPAPRTGGFPNRSEDDASQSV